MSAHQMRPLLNRRYKAIASLDATTINLDTPSVNHSIHWGLAVTYTCPKAGNL